MVCRAIASLLLIVSTTACSSLIGDRQVREEVLVSYLNQSERLILYYPDTLQPDDQLKALFSEYISAPLVEQFPATATRGMIEEFLAASPRLADGATRIVDPAEWRALSQSRGTPVLFFNTNWQMAYRRWPLNVHKQKLANGAIAKVLPLGQVLAGKGTIALRTAVWEARCSFKPFEGEFFLIKEWAANDAGKLHEGVKAVQGFCGQEFARQFEQSLLPAAGRDRRS
jgi:hypothetical protein